MQLKHQTRKICRNCGDEEEQRKKAVDRRYQRNHVVQTTNGGFLDAFCPLELDTTLLPRIFK